MKKSRLGLSKPSRPPGSKNNFRKFNALIVGLPWLLGHAQARLVFFTDIGGL